MERVSHFGDSMPADHPRYFDSPKGQLLGLYAASVYLPSLVFAFVGADI